MTLDKNYIGGKIVKSDSRYVVRDNRTLNNLVLSSTELKARMATNGHSHEGQEEIYFFIEGSGQMELGTKKFDVYPNDIVLVPDGEFHRVFADGDNMTFICVFDGNRKS